MKTLYFVTCISINTLNTHKLKAYAKDIKDLQKQAISKNLIIITIDKQVKK